jgi:hypothetical protein
MGALAVPPGRSFEKELAALRERAYGAYADIGNDPAALARLAALEDWHAGAVHHDDDGQGAGGTTVATGRAAPRAREGIAARPPSGSTGIRVRSFLLGAATAAVVALVVAALVISAAPRPDAVLRATDDLPNDQVIGLVDYARPFLIDPSSLRSYGAYLSVGLWSADSRLGNRCLIAIEELSNRLLGASCVPPNADPSITIYDLPIHATDGWHEGLPSGTAVDFVMGDDAVSVWLFAGAVPD